MTFDYYARKFIFSNKKDRIMSVNVQERFELLKILGSKFCTVGTLTAMITMTMARILVQVTIYYRHQIGRDGHLDQSDAYNIS